MESDKSFVDVQEVVNEIRARVRARMGTQAARPPELDIDAARVLVSSMDLTSLHQAARRMRAAQALVGQMPPQPPGVRARVGAAIVGIVRRMLFWYTPQIHEFHRAAAQAAEEQEAIASSLSREVSVVSQTLQSLQASVSALERDIAQARASLRHEMQEIVEPIRTEFRRLADERSCLTERISRIEEALASGSVGRPSGLEATVQAADARIGEVQRRIDEVVAFTGDRLADLRTKLELQSHKVSALLKGSRPGALLPEEQRDTRGLDALYARFEDIFRGSREDIKHRVRVYLPVLSEAGIGGPDMPVLDIGCGRGEWLEVLKENGIQARGVDANRAMVARCELLGLPVTEADVIEYLKSLPPASFGAITGLHVVEHLPFGKLLDLLDETARVLKPGGVAIFETPNPGNLLVGASNFYTDPTHRHPLPERLLQFLAEARGFSRVEAMALHPYPDELLFPGDAGAVGERLNDLLYGPQDYAIIAGK